jgi:hypothetical protein|nr:hypothetical protein [Rhodanobacter glycinis]
MNAIENLHRHLHRHMPLLIAASATLWTVFACGWSLYAFAHPL